MLHRQIARIIAPYRNSRFHRAVPRLPGRRRVAVMESLEPRCLLAAGDPDTSFNADGLFTQLFEAGRQEVFHAVGQQSDGKLVFAGESRPVAGGQRDIIVARVKDDGTVDTSFGTSGFSRIDLVGSDLYSKDQQVFDLAVDSLDRIVVVGRTQNLSPPATANQLFAIRLLANGVWDSGFDSDAGDSVNGLATIPTPANTFGAAAYSVAVDGNDNVVVAGQTFFHSTDGHDFLTVRFTAAGIPDPAFGTSGVVITDFAKNNDVATDVAIDSTGRVVVTGAIFPTSGFRRMGVARYTSSGSPDSSFGPAGPNDDMLNAGLDNVSTVSWEDFGLALGRSLSSTSLAIQSDGRMIIAGALQVDISGNSHDMALARLDGNGALDNTFAGDGTQTVNIQMQDVADPVFGGPSVAVQSDGKIVAASSVGATTTDSEFGLARLDTGGLLDNTFGTSGLVQTAFSEVTTGFHRLFDLLIQPDGPIVAAGAIKPVSGNDFQLAAARYLSDAAALPIADAGGPYDVDEGGTVQLMAAADPTATLYEWDRDDNGVFEISGQNVPFDAGSLNGPGTQTVHLRVTGPGGVATDTTTVNILNVAPTVEAGGQYATFFDGPIPLSGAATDPVDALTIEWDLDDDGNFGETGAAALAGDETGLSPTFDPSDLGIAATTDWPIALRATDDAVSVTDATTVKVIAAGASLIDGTLFVGGTTGGESVAIQIVGGLIEVSGDSLAGGSALFDPNQVNLIDIHLGAGGDILLVDSGVSTNLHVDGGSGSDLLVSGSGEDVLLGGPGDDLLAGGDGTDVLIGGDGLDQLFGGGGRDILIGGTDMDWLWGGNGEDILIGGTTMYDDFSDADALALAQIKSIWTSGDTYDQRVATLTGASGLLEAGVAVFNDDAADVFVGGSGVDLYFADLGEDVLLFASAIEDIIGL